VKRLSVLVLAVLIGLTGCSFGGGNEPTYRAEFSRAVQVFPGIQVRILGVSAGLVTSVVNVKDGVQVSFRMNPDMKLPSGVNAAVVPSSLLGERYIQLFPAYQGGPVLRPGSTIPLSRTAVPAEPDEVLRSLQDYMGGLDSETVTNFVANAAKALDGSGDDLNRLIEHGASVIETLAAKRDDLAQLVVELNKLTVALSTRQEALGRLIRTYGTVTGTLNTNRAALEGTITGLNQAALQLAALLIAHRDPLHADVKALARTGRTLQRNEESFADTGRWATLLFQAATRAVDYDHDWLRLNNQGQELGALILMRLEERLMELCEQSGSPECSVPQYWAVKVPQLFCFRVACPTSKVPASKALAGALASAPNLGTTLALRANQKDTTIQHLIDNLLRSTVGNPTFFQYGVSP
jgi:phospholipid/cholesterol/gamma-HCH transport system substrate-binding protein